MIFEGFFCVIGNCDAIVLLHKKHLVRAVVEVGIANPLRRYGEVELRRKFRLACMHNYGELVARLETYLRAVAYCNITIVFNILKISNILWCLAPYCC